MSPIDPKLIRAVSNSIEVMHEAVLTVLAENYPAWTRPKLIGDALCIDRSGADGKGLKNWNDGHVTAALKDLAKKDLVIHAPKFPGKRYGPGWKLTPTEFKRRTGRNG